MASPTSPLAASEPDSYVIFKGTAIKISGDKKKVPWFIESTAANHITSDPSLITELVPMSNKVVDAGIGKGMQVCGIGKVKTEAVVLDDVWFVPELSSKNLVSVDQVTNDPDLIITIAGTGCHVKKMSDGSVVGSAHLRPDNKYEVDFLRIHQN
ncbi:unnamed protein product [Urochloa decumbens]|uniref:Retrovirus-related Pol polyprotein from transposon TNT 1-94-like beta-barrel domain-containing protein n=1 Tax=Urochloa decumbens TaxID=240449 RepID=A0ABC9AYD8_9POAL